MNKIVIENIYDSTNQDYTEIAFHNMKIAENIMDLTLFIGAQMGFFMANPEKNFQDLEKELRERGFFTHIIAKLPSKYFTNYKLSLKGNNTKEIIYQGVTSLRHPPHATNELLETWKSYEENFNALKYTGFLIIDNEKNQINESMIDENFEMFDNSDSNELSMKNIIYKLSNNKIKLQIVPVRIGEDVYETLHNLYDNTI